MAATQSVHELEAAMARVSRSRVGESAAGSPWFLEARDAHYQRRSAARMSEVAKSFTLVSLLFMVEQPKPSKHLLALLKATYLLLGENPEGLAVGLKKEPCPL